MSKVNYIIECTTKNSGEKEYTAFRKRGWIRFIPLYLPERHMKDGETYYWNERFKTREEALKLIDSDYDKQTKSVTIEIIEKG